MFKKKATILVVTIVIFCLTFAMVQVFAKEQKKEVKITICALQDISTTTALKIL